MSGGDSYTDYSVFANPSFEPNDYANAILAGESYSAGAQAPAASAKGKTVVARGGGGAQTSDVARENISVALTKLNFGIDDVAKQLRNVVVSHHEALLSQAAGVGELDSSLKSVRQGLTEVSQSLEKLRLKIRVPYQNLAGHVARLQRLQLASDVLRRTSRFVILARRLEVQMAELDKVPTTTHTNGPSTPTKERNRTPISYSTDDAGEGDRERGIAKAALTIAELVTLSSEAEDVSEDGSGPIPLKSINAVSRLLPSIEASRVKVTSDMEAMVQTGLQTLNQSILASSLQTAFNLQVLPQLVQNLLSDLTEGVEFRIKLGFDVSKLAKEASAKESNPPSSPNVGYRSRVRTEPTNITAPQWTSALWSKLEVLIEDLAAACIKVYTLEKVLKLKKDAVSQISFIDEAYKLLENKPSLIFWTSLAKALERQSRESAKSSTFIQQTLTNGYPKFLRLFHDFFSKISVHTDTVYTQSQQSPETVLVLRAVSNFESLYLSRSSNRLNEVVASALSGGTRSPPGFAEGTGIARTVANELDSARFDPLLVRSLAKNAVSALDLLVSRVDTLFSRDRLATSLVGPMATPQEAVNASLVSALYGCWSRLSQLGEEYDVKVVAILDPSIKNLQKCYERVCDPLLTAIKRELNSITARLHRVDFGRPLDASAGLGGGPSAYMKELVDKLSFVKGEILGKFNVGDLGKAWVQSIVKHVIRTFILHVSIAKPLGESGKLQLTSDMTELEFALSAFMAEPGSQSKRNTVHVKLDVIGDEYRALRAFRPLLFADNKHLAGPEYTNGLSPLVVLHHILVRSPLTLPHTVHGWHEAEYVRWVEEHSEKEAWTLVEGCLSRWEAEKKENNHVDPVGQEYVELARVVLRNAESR